MDVPEEYKGHVFPQALLKQIDENSLGGFMLFWITEDGNPTIYSTFEDECKKRAVISYASDVIKGIKSMQYNIDFGNIHNSQLTDIDEDEDGYEESYEE